MAANPTTPAQAQKLYPTPQDFASFLNQHWVNQRITKPNLTGANVGDQFLNWYASESAKHPSYTLGQFEVTFFELAVAASLAKAMVAAEVATGQFTAQAAQATVSGLDQTGKALGLNWLSGNFGTLLMRIGEVAVGVVLVAIGLNALLKNPAGKAVKTAAKVA